MATIEIPSSPTDTIKPHKRRDTETSNISEDDIAALRSMEVDIEGESKKDSTNKQPSFSVTSASGSAEKPSSSKPGGGVSMSSLRSLLGIPGQPSISTSSSSGANGKTLNAPQSIANSKIPNSTSLAPPSSRPSSSLLGVPPSTSARTAPQGIGGASGARILGGSKDDGEDGREMLKSEIAPKRKKVVLEPGCSALDWARTKQEILSERMKGGPESMRMKRITKEELKQHNSLDDAWSSFQGKVYDLTPYMKFHPGGKKELMRVAGRDGTRLFMLTHSWVNIDAMIDACCIGVLVSDS